MALMHTLTSKPLMMSLISMLLCTVCLGQGLDSYALVHPFGLASGTNARAFGMGGQASCVWGWGSGNPAFAVTHSKPLAGIRVSATSFDRGPDVLSKHAHLVWPLHENVDSLQLTLFSLSSEATQIMLAPSSAAIVDIAEEDLSVQYSRRINPRLTAGIGLSPYSKIELAMVVPGGPTLRDIQAEPDYGARLGLAYEFAPGDYFGLVYDYYQETAKASGVALLGRTKGVFISKLLAVGVSKHLSEDLLVAAEYQDASAMDGPRGGSLSGWHVGAEYLPVPGFAVRAGLNDERLSAGLGHKSDRWEISYAYINRWNDDVAGDMFGASDTHQLQAICRW